MISKSLYLISYSSFSSCMNEAKMVENKWKNFETKLIEMTRICCIYIGNRRFWIFFILAILSFLIGLFVNYMIIFQKHFNNQFWVCHEQRRNLDLKIVALVTTSISVHGKTFHYFVAKTIYKNNHFIFA